MLFQFHFLTLFFSTLGDQGTLKTKQSCSSPQENSLLESWTSLLKFNQCQRSRILNIGYEGDIFDEFLQQQRIGRQNVAKRENQELFNVADVNLCENDKDD